MGIFTSHTAPPHNSNGKDIQKGLKKPPLEITAGQWKNGFRYSFIRDRSSRSVAVNLLVRVGSKDEPSPEFYGIAHFVEHMLFKSTVRTRSNELARPVYMHGGDINAATDLETTQYYIKLRPRWVDSALLTLAQMLREPFLDDAQIELERTVIQAELADMRSNPHEWAVAEILPRIAFPDLPQLAHPVGGSSPSIAKMSPAMLRAFFSSFYRPDNMCLSVYGAWPTGFDLPKYASNLFATWKGTLLCSSVFTGPTEAKGAAIQKHVDAAQSSSYYSCKQIKPITLVGVSPRFTNIPQTLVSLVFPGASFDASDSTAWDIVMAALVATLASKLYVELREKRGLIYFIEEEKWVTRNHSRIAIVLGVTNSVKHITEVLEIVENIRRELESVGLSKHERTVFRRYLHESILLAGEDTAGMAAWYGDRLLRRSPFQFYTKYAESFLTVCPQDIQSAARQWAKQLKSGGQTFMLTSSSIQKSLLRALRKRSCTLIHPRIQSVCIVEE